MNLEFLYVSALFQPHAIWFPLSFIQSAGEFWRTPFGHTPFGFLFHSFSQQASFGVAVCQKSFKKSESVGYFRSPLGTVGGDFGMSF